MTLKFDALLNITPCSLVNNAQNVRTNHYYILNKVNLNKVYNSATLYGVIFDKTLWFVLFPFSSVTFLNICLLQPILKTALRDLRDIYFVAKIVNVYHSPEF
jgi:hypothetical protein